MTLHFDFVFCSQKVISKDIFFILISFPSLVTHTLPVCLTSCIPIAALCGVLLCDYHLLCSFLLQSYTVGGRIFIQQSQ